jgi:soluble lytic murein transglycosylase-like protein
MASAARALLLVGLLGLPGAVAQSTRPGPQPGAGAEPTCALDALRGLRTQLLRGLRETREQTPLAGTGLASTLDAARAADFSRVAHAVLGPGAESMVRAVTVSPDGAAGSPTRAAVPCSAAVRSRDALAWRMGLGGYSAQEIADVLGGHLTLGDLQQARARLLSGRPRTEVATFLERQWKPAPAETVPAPVAPGWNHRYRPPALAELEPALVALANYYALPADLVRAVIAAESAGNPRAVSPAGAIGLMQLMPGTAAALGVDPWQPLDNLRGGIAYLASLVRDFNRNFRLALVAYNAGPQHARAVQAGRAVAYRETRAYLDAINARYPLP